MTETLTTNEVLKSKQNFADYIKVHSEEIMSDVLNDFPERRIRIVIPQLTSCDEGLLYGIQGLKVCPKAYIFWFIVNEKERHIDIARALNNSFSKDYGIFIVKFYLDDENLKYECIVKPELKIKQLRRTDTPAKQLQKEYWEKYADICDMLGLGDYQVNPAPRHYQYIPIRKSGVQIMQTVNTQKKYIATELLITEKQEIFEKLLEHKVEIEEELGTLNWQALEGKKSSRIRKSLDYDINDKTQFEPAINEHLKMAEDFNKTFKKYL